MNDRGALMDRKLTDEDRRRIAAMKLASRVAEDLLGPLISSLRTLPIEDVVDMEAI